MGADNWADCPKCSAEGRLREDYEIGTADGEFYVYYRSKCGSHRETGCGYSFDFRHIVKVTPESRTGSR